MVRDLGLDAAKGALILDLTLWQGILLRGGTWLLSLASHTGPLFAGLFVLSIVLCAGKRTGAPCHRSAAGSGAQAAAGPRRRGCCRDALRVPVSATLLQDGYGGNRFSGSGIGAAHAAERDGNAAHASVST